MFGLGGIYVEVLKDVSFRASPLDRREAMGMVSEIRSYPLLLGVQGEERKDIEGILDVMLRLDPMLGRESRITDIEANPLGVFDQGAGVVALDVRILLKGPAPKPAHGAGPGPGTGPGQGSEPKEASA